MPEFEKMPLKTRLTISSWNVQGLFKRNDNERVSKLNDDDFLSHIKSDIVCLLETKADTGDNVSLKGYRLLNTNTNTNLYFSQSTYMAT